jgi:phage terminase Nu1 subunit (DNA packaging protein)
MCQEKTMSLMSVSEVADFLSVQEARVTRLERESLLIAKDRNAADEPMFDKDDVTKYKELAERLGGI